MKGRTGALLLPLLLLVLGTAACGRAEPVPLRVCADPNNLPFSDQAGRGFENRVAELLAGQLGRPLAYTWWAQRRGNVRETLNAGRCDLIIGTGAGLEMLATTEPYYASTYVAVTRADRDAPSSFDDPALRRLRIGVQMVGDDFSNTPPAHALARRGITANVRGYMIYGDYGRPDPQAGIVRAVASGEVDLAYVWGPVAAYYARTSPVPLRLTPLPNNPDERMAFAVSMGVRRADRALKSEVEAVLRGHRREIDRILDAYGVPRIPVAGAATGDDEDDEGEGERGGGRR